MNSRDTRLILGCAAVLLSLGMGIRQSFGLFLSPVTRDLAVTAADFTLAVAVQNIVWGVSQAPIGAIADRFGLRATMMAGGPLGPSTGSPARVSYETTGSLPTTLRGCPSTSSGWVSWPLPAVLRGCLSPAC